MDANSNSALSEMLQRNHIVVAIGVVALTSIALAVKFLGRSKKKQIALDPLKKLPFKLQKIEQISPDTKKFTFSLQTPQHILGLPVGKHMYLSANISGRPVIRAYTPVSSDDDIGIFELVVKIYKPNDRFPNGGEMSQYLDGLKVGDTIDVRGPLGKIEYKGSGVFVIETGRNEFRTLTAKNIAAIAGGTGITPILQVFRDALKRHEDSTQLSLIFGNQTENDILLRDELDAAKEKHKNRLKVHYSLDRPPADWAYSKGFVTEQMISDHLPAPGSDSVVLLCGPPPMIRACEANLTKIGYSQDRILIF